MKLVSILYSKCLTQTPKHILFRQMKACIQYEMLNHNITNHDDKYSLPQKNSKAAKRMERKIQAHTVSPPHTCLPHTTFSSLCHRFLLLKKKNKKHFNLFTPHLFEVVSGVLGHLL